MKGLIAALALLALTLTAGAHDFGTRITWNREISRIVYDRCASCHRPGGTAFSLMTYVDVQPRSVEIKESVLARRMPPWGAVKGFGSFRNEQALTQEQVELVTRWVDSGAARGNNPRMLPKEPTFEGPHTFVTPPNALKVAGELKLEQVVVLEGLVPEKVPSGRSLQIFAELPNGSIEPLVWLHEYDDRYRHPFWLRSPLRLPSGTMIRGVPSDALLALIPRAE